MPKATLPPKSKKPPRKVPDHLLSPIVSIKRTATKQDVGDMADKITRAPRKAKTKGL